MEAIMEHLTTTEAAVAAGVSLPQVNRVIDEKKRGDAAHTEAIADKDRRIAELAAENDKLAAEKEECRQSASEGWAKHHDALVEIERLKLKCGELLPDERKPDADL